MFYRIVCALFVLIIIGCNTHTAVVEPKPPPNQPPVIDRVILPTIVQANTPVKLQVIVHDTDQDNLTIIWEASEGTVDKDVWTPPDRVTQVVISVHVTDHKNQIVTQSKNIAVTKEPTPEPEFPRVPDPPQPKDGEAWTIIPRVGIEHIAPGEEPLRVNIGDTIERVTALAERTEWASGSPIHFHRRLGKFQCSYRDGKVIVINLEDPRYQTPDGIRVGTHIEDVIATYRGPKEIRHEAPFILYYYLDHGYIFATTTKGIIVGIILA